MPTKPKYRKEYCEKIIEWFKDGSTITEVSQKLGITRRCYYYWKDKHPDFKEAAEFGEEAAEAWHTRLGRAAMVGFKGMDKDKIPVEFNTAVWCFFMKTRFKYREIGDPEGDPNAVSNAQPLQINFQVSSPVGEIEITNSAEQQKQNNGEAG